MRRARAELNAGQLTKPHAKTRKRISTQACTRGTKRESARKAAEKGKKEVALKLAAEETEEERARAPKLVAAEKAKEEPARKLTAGGGDERISLGSRKPEKN